MTDAREWYTICSPCEPLAQVSKDTKADNFVLKIHRNNDICSKVYLIKYTLPSFKECPYLMVYIYHLIVENIFLNIDNFIKVQLSLFI